MIRQTADRQARQKMQGRRYFRAPLHCMPGVLKHSSQVRPSVLFEDPSECPHVVGRVLFGVRSLPGVSPSAQLHTFFCSRQQACCCSCCRQTEPSESNEKLSGDLAHLFLTFKPFFFQCIFCDLHLSALYFLVASLLFLSLDKFGNSWRRED